MIADDGKTRILAVGMFMAAWRHIKGKGGRKSIKQFSSPFVTKTVMMIS